MPFLRYTLSPHPELPKQARFWDVVRVDPRTRILSLDPEMEGPKLLEELQKEGVIGGKALLENFRIERWGTEDGWQLLYVVGKNPRVLLEIIPPADRQLSLFP